MWTMDEVIDKLFEEFEQREWEGKTLKTGDDEYTQNALPPRKVIEDMVGSDRCGWRTEKWSYWRSRPW